LNFIIISVVGPICAGKDELASILVEKGFLRLSLADELRGELDRRGVEITRKNMQDVGDELRMKEGIDFLAKRIVGRIEGNCVITGFRSPAEVKRLREFGSKVLMVDAPFDLRFSRAVERNREGEPLDLEGFRKMEERDLGIGQPEHGQQNAKCFELADSIIVNDGSFNDLRERIDEVLNAIS